MRSKAYIVVLLGLLAPAVASAIEVREKEWGFDGTVKLGEFNQLSIYIHNESPSPFRGRFVLRKGAGNSAAGAKLVSDDLFLSPNTGRWLTFFPFIKSPHEEWVVSWGNGFGERKELDPPTASEGAVVYLWVNELDQPPNGIHAMHAARFPVTVGATAGLRAVFLDRVPDWDAARRRAFLDWLYEGGRLHLLSNPGVSLSFVDELAELNNPADEFSIGEGRVVRHAFPRAQLSQELIDAQKPVEKEDQDGMRFYGISTDESLLRRLQSIVRPQHNWALIYTSTIAFLLIVGPINAYLSRKKIGYRASLSIVCLSVALFGFGFYLIGQQGYDARTVVHSIAFAKPLHDGWDVTQYTNAFVTRGDRYEFRHHTRQNLYTTAQSDEPVRGEISASQGGAFVVEIPIYSSRDMIHRGTLQDKPFHLTMQSPPGNEFALSELVLQVGSDFPQETLRIYAVQGLWSRELRRDGDRLFPIPGTSKSLKPQETLNEFSYLFYSSPQEKPLADEVMHELMLPLICKHLGIEGSEDDTKPREDDRVRVFVLAKAPDSFSAITQGVDEDHKYVIYAPLVLPLGAKVTTPEQNP